MCSGAHISRGNTYHCDTGKLIEKVFYCLNMYIYIYSSQKIVTLNFENVCLLAYETSSCIKTPIPYTHAVLFLINIIPFPSLPSSPLLWNQKNGGSLNSTGLLKALFSTYSCQCYLYFLHDIAILFLLDRCKERRL